MSGGSFHTAESFQSLLLRHRGRTGLTQRRLASRAGVSRRSIQDWEAGLNYPEAQRLQALTVAFLRAGGLTVGSETAEAKTLWEAALRQAPRMQTPFDGVWWDGLLARRTEPIGDTGAAAQELVVGHVSASQASERRQDWGEAPDPHGFVGRAQELATLRDWVLGADCRLVAVLGMGGIGKTILAAQLAQEVAPAFHRVYWRSLRDALPTTEWLAGAISFLSDQQLVPPEGEPKRLEALVQLLRDRRSLLVLDNFETLLEPGQREGRYRDEYLGYGRLLQALGERRHQGCLVVTSRERPPEWQRLDGGAVRAFQLDGLAVLEGQALLADKQLSGNDEDWVNLIGRFGGNGLALKMVGESIREVFGGDVGVFLHETGSTTVFGGIRRLLAEQLERSSALEQRVLHALAIEREPLTIGELLAELGARGAGGAVLETVEALRRRSVLERVEIKGGSAFTLQSVVLEYVTDRLVEGVADEIASGRPAQLIDQPLIKAQAKDYVRHSQERLIGEAVVHRLEGRPERELLALLDGWRNRPELEQGYGPGNVVNLLRLARGDLRDVDLAHLSIRQAYLAGVEVQDASLAGAHLNGAVLAEAFNFPLSVALSRDGTSLVTGTSAGEVWLWRVVDRIPLLAVQAHAGQVYGVALSADARLLASGGLDGVVRLWEAPSGRLLATLQGHTGVVWSVAVSADARLLASGSFDGTVRLWEPPSGRLLATLQAHTGGVRGVALSADGRMLGSCGLDGTVRLWEAPTGRSLARLQGHTDVAWSVALSADGSLLASGGLDRTVRLWETPSGRRLATLQGHTGGVRGVTLSADGRLLASCGFDGIIRLWETQESRLLATLHGHTAWVYGVALSEDGQLLASGSEDGTVRLWDTPSGRLLSTSQGHTGGVRAIALSADGQRLASGEWDGTIRLWEAPTGRPLVTLRGHTSGVRRLALSADGRLLASGSEDGTVRLWEAPSGRLLATLQGHTGMIHGVALSAAGRLLASGGDDGTVCLWEAPGGRLLATLQGHTDGVRGVALSADGQLLASGSFDGTVRLWETASGGQLLASLEGHTGGVRGVALSADGRLLASSSWDGTVRLWETPAGRPLATLQGPAGAVHAGGVWGVALSPDGRLVAGGADEGSVRLWETQTGRLLGTLEGHTDLAFGVAFSADGRMLASGSFDGTVRLWDPSSRTCLRTLRSDRRYERLDITGLTGVTAAQHAALLTLGAVDLQAPADMPSRSTG